MKRILLTLVAAIGLTTSALATTANYNIVPKPRRIDTTLVENCYSIKGKATLAYPTADAEMAKNAAFLKQYLKEVANIDVTLCPGAKKADITLALLPEKKRGTNPDAYSIKVDKKGILLQANVGEGIFRAIQTLRKSTPLVEDGMVEYPFVTIADEPRFSYRGQHLDCARHFFSVDFTKRFIDILAMHGINQFHWHITDDQGWRFQVRALPDLAEKACVRECTVIGHNCGIYDDLEYGRGCYYTQEQMRDIVKYAADRYINIIPEIDLPGHMVAALHVYPELGCTGGPYEVWPLWGVADDVLCAGNPKTLDFLKTVLGELCEVFPSKYIHIGGDESPRVRWEKCPKCQAKMKELGLKKEAQLQTYINKELEAFLATKGRTIIGWDETLEGGLSDNAIVMSWRGYEGGIAAAKMHHPVIMTPTGNCYIDYYQLKNHDAQPLAIGGYLPVSQVYSMEPMPEGLTEEEQQYILGPQCNLWTEYVLGGEHVEYMLLPRLAAMSEVQWLLPENKNYEDFTERLLRYQKLYKKLGLHYCRRFE